MIITSAEQIRNLTGSYYANNDFKKIESILLSVEDEISDIIGHKMMEQLVAESAGETSSISIRIGDDQKMYLGQKEITIEGDTVKIGGYSAYGIICRVEGDSLFISNAKAVKSCQQAVAFMATMRFYRLNDISHENSGRKVKIDKENEARPFEWQLARDDRAHLEEYYRALDRLMRALEDDPRFQETDTWKRKSVLIVKDADSLSYLTGVEPSPWLYVRMIPYLVDSQRFVEKAYGSALSGITGDDELEHAAQMAVALGAIALMGRRSSLQTLPYGLMKIFESDGGGNRKEAAALDRLDDYLKHLSREQHYWLNEMKQLRDEAAGKEKATHLQMPDNCMPKSKSTLKDLIFLSIAESVMVFFSRIASILVFSFSTYVSIFFLSVAFTLLFVSILSNRSLDIVYIGKL